MFGVKQKSYGEKYIFTKVKYKTDKRKLLLYVIALLTVAEAVLGILWLLGF